MEIHCEHTPKANANTHIPTQTNVKYDWTDIIGVLTFQEQERNFRREKPERKGFLTSSLPTGFRDTETKGRLNANF